MYSFVIFIMYISFLMHWNYNCFSPTFWRFFPIPYVIQQSEEPAYLSNSMLNDSSPGVLLFHSLVGTDVSSFKVMASVFWYKDVTGFIYQRSQILKVVEPCSRWKGLVSLWCGLRLKHPSAPCKLVD
jgi:hypothetical protein